MLNYSIETRARFELAKLRFADAPVTAPASRHCCYHSYVYKTTTARSYLNGLLISAANGGRFAGRLAASYRLSTPKTVAVL